jgi:hypothetical protein
MIPSNVGDEGIGEGNGPLHFYDHGYGAFHLKDTLNYGETGSITTENGEHHHKHHLAHAFKGLADHLLHHHALTKHTHNPFKYMTEGNKQSKHIVLNARGTKYEIPLNTLDRVPNSRLSRLKQLIENEGKPIEDLSNDAATGTELISLDQICDGYNTELTEFYFNKSPRVIDLILEFYQNPMDSKKAHIHSENFCAHNLAVELGIENFKKK